MSYLDDYGVTDAHREKKIKRAMLALVSVVAVTGFLYFCFKNYKEEGRVREFLAALQRGDYPAAYAFWGCRVESPCPNYDYKTFLEDWGPSSTVGKVVSYRLMHSCAQGSGVVVAIELNGRQRVRLWAETKNLELGFSPELAPSCVWERLALTSRA